MISDMHLNDLAVLKNGKKTTKLEKGKYHLYGANGPIGYSNDYNIPSESIIIGRVGANCGSVHFTKENSWISDNTIGVIPNNNVDAYYLYYLLKTFRLNEYASGSAQPLINQSILKSIEFKIASYVEQKKVGSFLRNLDDQIECKKNHIQHLEKLAQTLFTQWFIDYEFPTEEGSPYKSCGGKMDESELGEIPTGWKVVSLGEIAEIQNGFAFKSKDYIEKGIRVTRTLNISKSDLTIDNEDAVYLPIDFYDDEKYEKQKLQLFDTLLVMVGASIGNIGMVLSENLPSLQNQNMWRFRSKDRTISSTLIYFYVIQANKSVSNWTTGSAREFYRKDTFHDFKVAAPCGEVVAKANELFEIIFDRIDLAFSEIRTLTEIRDTLVGATLVPFTHTT